MTKKELRATSLDFRRLSSNLLNAREENVDVLIKRFKCYLDETPFISTLLDRKMNGIEYEYSECFRAKDYSSLQIVVPPADEACHIKAMYDYLTIVSNNGRVMGLAMRYPCSSRKFSDIIQNFVSIAFKPLIDFITDALSKEMLFIDEEVKLTAMTQNIGTVNGTVIQQESGNITSNNTTNINTISDIIDLINKVIPSLNNFNDVPKEDIECVKDDLESIGEQMKSSAPKKNRIQKAIQGVNKFFNDFVSKLAVSAATSAVLTADWSSLIEKVNTFISSI